MKQTDEEIKKDVVDQLTWDSRVDASKITVKVNDGVVTLSGVVPTYSARRSASTDAWVVPGVATVHDNLEVHYPVAVPTDLEIRSNVEKILDWNSEIDTARIEVSVENGEVTLEGSVDSFWKKSRVEDLVSDVRGVAGMLNKLMVVPTGDIIDETIGREIVDALERNANVDVDMVDVKVENGTVTLAGMVPNWRARRSAYEAALFTRGVINIRDNLVVSAVA